MKRTKYYVAYGSNLNVKQMAYRCPTAKIAGIGDLRGWELAFRGSRTGAYLTILQKKGSTVPVGIWEITEDDEKSLDRYEGFPTFYYKRQVKVEMMSYLTGTKKTVEAMVYIMHEDRKDAVPSTDYVRTCLDGCDDFLIDKQPIMEAYSRSKKAAS